VSTSFPVFNEIGEPDFALDPSVAYRAAHATEGPGIFEMPNDEGLVITRHTTLNDLKTHPKFEAQKREQRRGGSGADGSLASLSLRGPFFMNEPEHTPTAVAVYRPMSPARNDALVGSLRAIANRAADKILESGEANLVSDYAAEIAANFWLKFLGVPMEMRATFSHWSNTIVPMLAFERSEEQVAAANQSAGEMWTYLREHYESIKDSEHQNAFHLLGAALSASDVDGVPDNPADPIAAMTFDGIDSDATATANVLYTCLRHLEQLALVREDRSLIPSAWREAMRFEPSLIGLHRAPSESIDYAGVTIPGGVNVLMLWAAANRDPSEFDEPDRFDIHRANQRFLTFGGGARICKGRHLAKLQAEIALDVLLEKSSSVELVEHQPDWGRPVWFAPFSQFQYELRQISSCYSGILKFSGNQLVIAISPQFSRIE